ncbi:MAG: hypothetical protein ACLTDC_14485 [Lachnospiraceae bacterium]
MKIINNIEIDNPNQWIERFVEQVLENAGIDCEQALIEEIEEEKRILLSAGGQRYDIRIQAFLPVAADLNGMVCTENVQYVLYRKNTENGREYGEAIDDDFIRIQRGNTAAYEEVQEKNIILMLFSFFEKAMPDSCILLLNSVKSSQNALHIVLTFLK